MLESVFKAVLCMSVAGAILSALLLAARPLTKKIFGCNWNYYIWLAVLFVLFVPFSFKVSTVNQGQNISVNSRSVENAIVTHASPSSDSEVEISDTQHPMIQSGPSFSWVRAFSRIWILVSVSLFIIRILQYIAFEVSLKKHSQSATAYKNISVRHTDLLSAPLTVGIFLKTVYIPQSSAGTTDEEYILKHEYTHIKHMDIFLKWIFMIAKCVHWFNPFVYIISKKADEECEHVCDMAVTKSMNDVEKKEYMNAILNCISKSGACASALSTRMAGHSNRIVKRFEYITKKQKGNIWCTSLSAILFICFLFLGVTTSASAITELGDKSIPTLTINLTKTTSPSGEHLNLKTENNDVSPHIMPAEIPENIQSPSQDAPSDVAATQTDNFAVQPVEQSQLPPTDNTEHEEQTEENTVPAEEPTVSSEDDSAADYPGNMVGIMLLEDWSYEKMVNDLEASSIHKGNPGGASLNDVYISGELSYESGNVAVMRAITPSKRGRIDIYVDSEFEQLIEICFEQDGKQISGFSFVPDGESFYAFGGFDPQKQYDIIIRSSTGSTWKTTAHYVVC